ncbi:MAG: hypothetical protein OJF47_001368 [Nitrospira sp.]|nr:MAG: hypothetical protein OJF47_001368 [Nitrospira sp.]
MRAVHGYQDNTLYEMTLRVWQLAQSAASESPRLGKGHVSTRPGLGG